MLNTCNKWTARVTKRGDRD
ncbi:hypothetical protein MJ391_01120 [Escherichia coli]|nr:hypothetical protein MJ391_01120 [Escherichia coli]